VHQNRKDVIDMDLTPKPNKAVTMSLPDAMEKIGQGKRVRRISWPPEDYAILTEGWLKIFTKKEGEGKAALHKWTINDGDTEGQDWIVIVEKN